MILYYSPGACSLADHIALHEAGISFDRVKVDLKSHTTEDGRDFIQINPKGYVPALDIGADKPLTENIAILSWIADQKPALAPAGELGRYRLIETLAFISTEIHKGFKPFFMPNATEAEKTKAGDAIAQRLGLIAGQMQGDYLFGDAFGVADAYLFVMLMWSGKNGVQVPAPLAAFAERMKAREAVRLALQHEGLA